MTQTTSSDAAKARRLAFLLTQSVMPQEQKEAWIHLLPIMTQEQVDVLMGILEREHEGYKQTSANFLNDLKQLETELRSRIDQLKQEEQTLIEQYITKAISEYESKN